MFVPIILAQGENKRQFPLLAQAAPRREGEATRLPVAQREPQRSRTLAGRAEISLEAAQCPRFPTLPSDRLGQGEGASGKPLAATGSEPNNTTNNVETVVPQGSTATLTRYRF